MKTQQLSKKITSLILTGALSVICVAGLAGCSTQSKADREEGLTGGVAATVNGAEIDEDRVTRYINNMRKQADKEEDDAWAEYLSQQDKTPESLREDTLDTYIEQELIKQFASERNAEASEEEVQVAVDKMRTNYSSDDAWQDALEGAGFETEQDYRDALSFSITYKNLEAVFAAEDINADDAVKKAAQDKAKEYDGAKKSSHILFSLEDKETAQDILDQINAGTLNFEDAAREYSTDTSSTKGGDVGWDKATTFVEAYQTALDGLEVDQISQLVESEYGYHIIKCTDTFVAPEDPADLGSMPMEIKDEVVSTVQSKVSEQQAANEEASADDGASGESADNADDEDEPKTRMDIWLKEKRDSSDVVINPMPENVPYNVDMSKYETEAEQEEIDEEAAEETAEDVASTEQALDTADATGNDADAEQAAAAAEAAAEAEAAAARDAAKSGQ